MTDHLRFIMGIPVLEVDCGLCPLFISLQTDFYREKCERLEKDLAERGNNLSSRDDECRRQEDRIKVLEGQLKAQDMRHKQTLKAKDGEVKHLHAELDQKAGTIANLMTQLHTLRKRMQEVPLPSKEDPLMPRPPKDRTGSGTRRSSLRRNSSDLNPILQNPVIPRPPSCRRLKPDTPPDSNMPDPEPFLMLPTPPRGGAPVKRVTHAPLPPIAQSEDSAVRSRTSSRRRSQPERSPPSSSPEIETLAVDQVGREHKLRPAQDYPRPDCN